MGITEQDKKFLKNVFINVFFFSIVELFNRFTQKRNGQTFL